MTSYGGYLSYASGDRNCIRSRRNDSRWFSAISKLFKPRISKGFEETDRFFRRKDEYLVHSLDLVSEIPIWVKLRNFDECHYADDGIHFENGIEDYKPHGVPYLGYLKLHLQTAYPDITDLYNKIKKNHTDWTQKIKEIMSGQDIPYKPSFEKIIIDRISNCCPELTRSKDTGLSKNNIYIDQSFFNILFKALYYNLELDLLEVKHEDSTYQLKYAHNIIIAQGDEVYMYKLKDVTSDLVEDEHLKKIIQSYRDLSERLKQDRDRFIWKDKLMELVSLVQGGKLLEGDGACELCPPKLPS
jgi:hypothetical protein